MLQVVDYMFIFLSVNIVWYRQKCYAEVVIFQTNGTSLFVASVARRRRFVYDVSVCPVGDMDGPEKPRTAQVMSNALGVNKMPSQTSGLYTRFGLYIMSVFFCYPARFADVQLRPCMRPVSYYNRAIFFKTNFIRFPEVSAQRFPL